MVELVLDGVVGLDHALAPGDALQRVRQAVVGLRADHEIDHGRALDDLGAFGLRDASRHADAKLAANRCPLALQHADAPELGIDLLAAFSRIWQVLRSTRSASSITSVCR